MIDLNNKSVAFIEGANQTLPLPSDNARFQKNIQENNTISGTQSNAHSSNVKDTSEPLFIKTHDNEVKGNIPTNYEDRVQPSIVVTPDGIKHTISSSSGYAPSITPLNYIPSDVIA